MSIRRRWKPFVIPEIFLTSSTLGSSPLLHLPTELLIQIFQQANALDKLCLAFACKRLLQVSAFVSLKTGSPINYKASLSFSTREELLRLVRPLHIGEVPKHWAVCDDCLRYRPTKKSLWKARQTEWASTETWEWIVDSWRVRSSLQCPACWFEDQRVALRVPSAKISK